MKFQAIWPVLDPTMTRNELIQEGLADLPDVARRHHATITGNPAFRFLPGAHVPGSNGAITVLVAQADAEPTPHRDYWSE